MFLIPGELETRDRCTSHPDEYLLTVSVWDGTNPAFFIGLASTSLAIPELEALIVMEADCFSWSDREAMVEDWFRPNAPNKGEPDLIQA